MKEKTDGRVTVKVSSLPQLGGMKKEIFDAVEIGSIDFAIIGFGGTHEKYQDIGTLTPCILPVTGNTWSGFLNSDVVYSMFDEMEGHKGPKERGVLLRGQISDNKATSWCPVPRT